MARKQGAACPMRLFLVRGEEIMLGADSHIMLCCTDYSSRPSSESFSRDIPSIRLPPVYNVLQLGPPSLAFSRETLEHDVHSLNTCEE